MAVLLTRRLAWLISALLIVEACASGDRPTAPRFGPEFAISDGGHGSGTAGFYFLPPIVAQPAFSGSFDADIATLNPQIAICDITNGPDSNCGGGGGTSAVIVFTTTSTPAITVDPTTEQYGVSWATRAAGFDADRTYRVHVTAGASGARRELGFADVLLTTKPGQAKHVAPGDLVVVKDGRPLPIHFRIETGIVGSVSISAAAASVPTGGTDLLTATVRDLHGAPLAGAGVAWTVTAAPGVVASLEPASGPTTLLTAGTTPGTAVVAATSAGVSATATVTVTGGVAGKSLYVGSNGTVSILVYAAGASGNASPTATIAGGNTGLTGTFGIALDGAGNIYVANAGIPQSITVYAAGASGNATPTATIAGGNTGLNFPFGIALDGAGNIYVTNQGSNSITVYAAGASGNATPTATIAGGNTGLNSPAGIALDGAGNIYVTNVSLISPYSITVYAAGASGNATPTATIAGGNTGLSAPWGIARDGAGNLYVANGGSDSITVYAAGASGNVTPTATIAGGNTGLNVPFGIALDGAGNIYVTNHGSDSITVYAAGASGNATPTATIAGGNTGLFNGPTAITFYDPTQPPPATHLTFTVQPSNTAAGAAITPAVQVAVQNAQGNTVTTATTSITVAIGTNPASGTLSGTTTVAAVNGVATFANLSINNAGTGYTLTASATGLTGATSSAFNIGVGAAAKLVFTLQPSNTAAGAAIAPAVQVAVQDAQGNTVTTANASITVAIGTNPASGTLAGTTTVAAVNGVATFGNVSINNPGTGYTLTASATTLTGATSSSFNITVAGKPLYVANFFGHSITVYAAGASRNVTPTATIAGLATGLSYPFGIARDGAGNIYVANEFSSVSGGPGIITVYAAGASGNATPTATIAGGNTGLANPQGIALDGAGNSYVTNISSNSITVYAAGANGNATPMATIAGLNTGLDLPSGIALDGAGNIYVANRTGSITVYAAGASGNATPTATIAGGNTGLVDPQGIALDGAGNIYVPTGYSILVYAAGASGNATPTATIAGGNTGLGGPVGIALDGAGNIYVSNFTTSSITVYAAGASGNATPTATIAGDNTGLLNPVRLTF
jgi:sugar lactone lactonase YvrE